jgi:hypothetical protein
MNNKTEQQLADELDGMVTAVLQGEAPPATDDLAHLVADIVDVSAHTNPDPAFVAQLQRRLTARANELKKSEVLPKRVSFWQDLTQMLKEGFNMKRISYALGALIALIVFIGVYGLWRSNLTAGSSNEEVAQVTPEVAETPSIDVTSESEELAELPRFETQSPGMGGGGDGFAGSSGTAFIPMPTEEFDMKMMDPFSGTTFILNGTLPIEPVSGLVMQRPGQVTLDPAIARQVANQYGFTGTLYTEVYSSDVPSEGAGAPPATYIVFDGPRTLRIDSWSINYTDEAAAAAMDYENLTPYANAVAVAESFLTERGQLNFPYVAEPGFGNDVYFYRLVDGRKVNEPEIAVTINQNGQIVYIYDNVSTEWNGVGTYPLITAEQAWQKVLAGVFENNIQYQMMPADTGEVMPAVEPAVEYQYWPREFTPGSEVHLYEWPMVYRPVDGGTPLVKIRGFQVVADEGTLNALADGRDNQLHVWGTLNEDKTQLQLAGWEVMGEYNPIFLQGVVRRQGEQLLFFGQDGSTYILPNAPADIPDGLEVNVFGYGSRDTGLEHPVMDWESIEKYIDYTEVIIEEPAEGMTITLPIEPFVPFRYGEVQISGAELVYYITYLYPEGAFDGDVMVEPVYPTIYLQPAWGFSGTADNGDEIKLFVQAVAEEYLLPAP